MLLKALAGHFDIRRLSDCRAPGLEQSTTTDHVTGIAFIFVFGIAAGLGLGVLGVLFR